MSSITATQFQVLCELAGLAESNGRRHRRPTLEVLEARGLIDRVGRPTALGKVTARLGGWELNEEQQELIVALADGPVWASNAYRLEGDRPRAPVLTLRRLRAEGVAAVHTPGHAGAYGATKAGHELALILRQQELPPPVGLGGAMSAPMHERRCRKCGCTEDRACVDGWGDACAWSASDPTICSFCDENVPCDPGGPPPVRAAFAGAGAQGVVRGAS